MAAVAVGGLWSGMSHALIAWLALALSAIFYWKFPWVTLAASIVSLGVCIRVFYADASLHDPEGILYRHCFDFLIIAAILLGWRRSAKSEAALSNALPSLPTADTQDTST